MSTPPHLPETLGQCVARLRQECELTPDELGAPAFSPTFISAVEADKLRPSDCALHILAHNLSITAEELCAYPSPAIATPDPVAYGEDLLCQIEAARPLLYVQPRSFVTTLDDLIEKTRAVFPYLPLLVRYRFHYLRGNALLRLAQPAAAGPDLDTAMVLVTELGDAQEVERVRNALGARAYLQEQPALALTYHGQCLYAVRSGVVKDLTLRLIIYNSLASDYWALNDFVQALAIYHEALIQLQDVDHPDRRAEICSGLSKCYQALGNLDRAKLYAGQALAAYEAIGNKNGIGRQATNLAAILLAREEYAGMDTLLLHARTLLTEPEDAGPLSMAYGYSALLELQRADGATAERYANEALRLSIDLLGPLDKEAGGHARAYAVRTHAWVLGVAGQVAQQQHRPELADVRFRQALELVSQSEHRETAAELARTYAEVLAIRGDHTQAAVYYQYALDSRPRPRDGAGYHRAE